MAGKSNMVERSKKPFTLAAQPQKEVKNIRDKDNAGLEPAAPRWAQHPRPNIAPPGMSGIKRNMPVPQTARTNKAPRWLKHEFGDKARKFKPIVPKSRDKDHGHER